MWQRLQQLDLLSDHRCGENRKLDEHYNHFSIDIGKESSMDVKKSLSTFLILMITNVSQHVNNALMSMLNMIVVVRNGHMYCFFS